MISSDLLLNAYCNGQFPMAMEEGEIGWFSPNPRTILPLDQFHVPHGLKRVLKRKTFEIRINHCFKTVMLACAARDETWINSEIVESYCELNRLGWAHSVEAWQNGVLAGGLYGVAIRGAFFGESMFHILTDASKVALHALVERLRKQGFKLLYVQWQTSHLQQFGTLEISRARYLKLLHSSLVFDCNFVNG